ncbi:cytochrome P450 [Stakelama tenebrarum]|uniref:Cytochrome P450 n=1 Tax=Stakelama tenebrarum TaxID=2711215 RepID=A0A6G6Y755_9SPHN|nr:cytochrome P450 [Sphingosinithalassobacter tenebrarum]QIG80772.1 cytochrome P450 [Sphingosinithalassobacter tenebrarum]
MVAPTTDTKPGTGCPAHADPETLLSQGSLIDPDISAHPADYYAAMRSEDPVHFDPKLGMYLISRWEDIQQVQRDPITFSVEKGYKAQYAKGFFEEFEQILERDGGGYFPDAIMSDPPYHSRIRKLMDSAFSAHRVKALEPGTHEIVADIIEGFADKGQCDAVKDFAVPITIRVICDQLGIAQYNAEKISKWSYAVTQQIGRMQNREQMIENAKDICELQNFLIGEVKDREANPKEDMISDLVHAETDDPDNPRLTFKEVVSLVRALMIAGNETTATAMTNLMYILSTQPKVLETLQNSVDDDRLMNRFVEELLRIEPPVRGLSRMTTKEVEVGGVTLPEGAHLLLMYASANDQPEMFECPREFNMDRPNLGKHVAFGGGPHRCIGLALARMEIRVAAREVVKRLDNLKLGIAVEDIRYLPTVATHSIEQLPITFTRR